LRAQQLDTERQAGDAQSKLEQIEYQLRRRALSALQVMAQHIQRRPAKHAVASWKTKSRPAGPDQDIGNQPARLEHLWPPLMPKLIPCGGK